MVCQVDFIDFIEIVEKIRKGGYSSIDMQRKKRRKIFIRLMIGALVVFVGLVVEFFVHRYITNRSVVFRTEGISLEICRDKKWRDFTINGATVGSLSLGTSGETEITRDEYGIKFKQLSAMGINVIRIDTILPPAFYRAFFEYNIFSEKPLYLLHGIRLDESHGKTNLNAFENRYNADFLDVIGRTIDVVHGKAASRQSNGHASSAYKFNISPYVMGYILCEDMGTDFVLATNEKNSHVMGFEGDYIYTVNASPYEAWLAAMGNFAISYEQEKYGGPCKLVCWTNWSGFEKIQVTEKFNAGILASNHLQEKFTPYQGN